MTERNTSIQVNMLMNVLLTLSSIIFPLITLQYVTRILGPENLGNVYFVSSAVSFFSIFAELGIPVYGIRACARVRNNRDELTDTAHEIIVINIISSLAVYVLIALLLFTVPRFAEDRFLVSVMSSSIILNALGAEWLFKALEKYTYITVRSLIFKALAVAAIFILIHQETDYVVYGFLSISAAIASNIVNMIGMHRYIDMKKQSRLDLLRHLPGMLTLFSLAAAATIYTSLDTVLLGFIKGDVEVGYYGVAVKIKLTMVNIITSISAVLLPRVSYLMRVEDTGEYHTLLRRTMTGVNVLSLPMVCFIIIFADRCVMILAGSEFSAAVLPMQIIMPSVVFIGISNIIGMQMLVPKGKEKAVSFAAWAGAVLDLLLNAVLIPRFASSGASVATLMAEILVMIYLLVTAGSEVKKIISVRAVLTAAAAALAAVPTVIWIRKMDMGNIATLLIAAVCYFCTYIIVLLLLNAGKVKNELLR